MKKYLFRFRWEFWPTWLAYLPVEIMWPYFMIKTRKFKFWRLVNPGIPDSGLFESSKFEILSKIPNKNRPRSILIEGSIPQEEIIKKMSNTHISFPCVVKPDIGRRGYNVKKIEDKDGLREFIEDYDSKHNKKKNNNILIQNFITEEKEFGVFYIKEPSEEKGSVVSLAEKIFPYVKGDGRKSLKDLISEDRHLLIRKKQFFKEINDVNYIPKNGEIVQISILGNHAQGSIVHDRNDQIDDKISNIFDEISKKIPGFYYGRYDVKANSIEDIRNGNFKILELNGLSADPLHMFDENVDYVKGWGIVVDFWMKALKIAIQNNKDK